ncbi:thiamine pyrophosphate-binding protein [Nonomuraea turcica]|uniref:thiamine pyrophosphate-binding protein n=1 Tax=Nonomuraea sp. G32 TaxID=3067274 RepID=UPI00273A8E11|nr:thiamine pyrophosphate-binding protein [Nonomuraea sp. G32]MDP4501600.1 thiamine pyrophosphate-binding protein [Nonomuraea sp. G32]
MGSLESAPKPVRTGGDLVVESLAALGATTVFGEPGQHALGLFDALRRAPLRYVGCRTELSVALAADGHARATGSVTPFLVSTGPGALGTLPALMESRTASVPVLGISSQIPADGLGGGRKGYLHELPDQAASFRDVVKSVHVVRTAGQIVPALAQAWEAALTAPAGPVWVEIPQDVLLGATDLPTVAELRVAPRPLTPRAELVTAAGDLLAQASAPVILAGGGVVRAGAQAALLDLAEELNAPVATTFGGKGAFPWEHPLSLRSWLEDRHLTAFLEDADVLLVVGSGLGELSSNYHTMRPRGRVIQIEADLGKLESNHPALAVHADARLALEALAPAVKGAASKPGRGPAARDAVRDVLARVAERLDAQDLTIERALLAAVDRALPAEALSFWDMTILAYWAWSAWPRPMESAQGAGGLGYALPAALGAAAATGGPVLAVSGDGGAMYGLAELATLRQHDLDVTWLIVDDGGYGILREYMTGAFGVATATELARPDFVALAAAFGVPACRTTPADLEGDLARALRTPGPSVIVLPATLRMFAPTHLG